MNTRNKIDDLFKEAMAGYRVEPSIGLWRRIERRFFPPSRFSPSGLITSIFLLIVAGLMPWLLIPANKYEDKEPNIPAENARRGYLIKPVTLNKSFTDPQTMQQTAQVFSVEPVFYEASSLFTGDHDSEELYLASAIDPADDPAILPLINAINDQKTIRENKASEPVDKYTPEWIHRMTSRKTGLMNTTITGEDLPTHRENNIASTFSPYHERSYFRTTELSLGANFVPTVVFYDPNPYNQMLGGEAIVRLDLSGFRISSGIGYSRMEDIGSYRIDYKSYDSVGYFLDVVSFSVDPKNPDDIVLLLREEAIYDSVPHFTITEKNNSYSYIDIPLSFGYSFLNNGRISLSVNAGIKFSWLVHKNEPVVDFSVSNGELIGIERQVPARMSTNWRFTAGLDVGYLLTDRWSLHLEPVFEQYISPVYTKEAGYEPRKPIVTGVKAGIFFKL
ncbi:MAG: hypothetical protein K0B08_09305 [Bacteroidales bacterium]|nr:hypothetical protein [Bacteroidales bacterium]